MPNWTKEQEDAINRDGANIIVSAGAGSGKTAVLSARVIHKLKSGVDINHLLILTFTNEAASEMKERIRKSIKKEPDLKRQLDYVDQAYITTFDSYALSIVKKYHYILGLSKNIGIIDSSIVNILRKKYLNEIMLKKYEEEDSDFLKLVGDFCTKDDQKIIDLILSINSKLDLRYDKRDYLTNYIDNFYNDDYISSLIVKFMDLLRSKLDLIKFYLDEISIKADGMIYEKYFNALNSLLCSSSYDEIKNNVDIKLPTVRNSGVVDREKNLIKGILKELQELTIYKDLEDIKSIYYSTMPYLKAICSIILDLDSKINDFKYSKESFEFVDIAHLAIKIVLENENIKDELKNYYNEIMVDEYQDTNDLQEMFISMIANNNVYMVGDIKQSIYRFRNANPVIFKSKYENYSNNDGGVKIDLLKNFRSRGEVLDDINILFDKIMDIKIGGADYKVSHRMVFGNNTYLDKGNNNLDHHLEIYNYDNTDKTFSSCEKEIFIIANDIKKKISDGYSVLDKESGILRKANYNDFCIILDRGKEFVRYKKIFEYLGIPLTIYEDEKLTIELDIYVLKNLFKMILLLNDNVSLFDKEFLYCYTSVARSFLFNYDDSYIYDAIRDVSLLKSSSLYLKCLEISRNVYKYSPVMIIDKIINSFDYYEKLISAFDVDKAIIRVDYLRNIALNIENLGFTNDMFLEYLTLTLEDKNSDIKYKINTKSSGESVKLMNIHKSKGLEFPICYFAGFYEKFNVSDLKSRFLYDDTYGIITPYYKEGIGSFINKDLYKDKYYIDEVSEKIRLFYVAVTRAREKMIIVCSLSSNEDCSNINMVSDDTRLMFRSFLDIISAIKFDLLDFIKDISLDDIFMTKDYDNKSKFNYDLYIPKCDIDMVCVNNDIKVIYEDNKHFSKSSLKLITKDEKLNMIHGTKLHEIFERDDFNNPKNEYVKKFLMHDEINLIRDANTCIYKEYEFMYNDDITTYHGIIDLLIVGPKYALIIDYKMMHIVDDAYRLQLGGYKDYISKKLGIPVKTYLYAIIPDVLEEIE